MFRSLTLGALGTPSSELKKKLHNTVVVVVVEWVSVNENTFNLSHNKKCKMIH